MQINNNIRAMVTQHALFQNNNAMSKSLEKLSTGLKINRAQDDAAGLAMSEQMRTQIRGLGKAKQNAQDGQAALQIAEGGLAEITNLMQRQRELAVQAANDTLTSTERKYLNDEFQELTKEIARIASTTDYNGKNMLNWDQDPNKSFGAVGGVDGIVSALRAEEGSLESLKGKLSDFAANGDYDFTGDIDTVVEALGTFITAIEDADEGDDLTDDLTTFQEAVADFKAALGSGGENGEAWDKLSVRDQDILNSIANRLDKVSANSSQSSPINSLGELAVAAVKTNSTGAASFTLHVGPNYSNGGGVYGNSLAVTYLSLNPGALGLAQRSINTQFSATDAIDQLDKVIKSVSGARAKIGTFINRLEYTVNNIANLEFNTQDAESRIRDTDFAKETTNFTRNQIMVQSATSMLAQANALPQSVLGLIG